MINIDLYFTTVLFFFVRLVYFIIFAMYVFFLFLFFFYLFKNYSEHDVSIKVFRKVRIY